MIKVDSINTSTIDFFLMLLDKFDFTTSITIKTSDLAAKVDKSARTVRRYIDTLHSLGYIYRRYNWRNKNGHAYKYDSTYTLTTTSEILRSKAAFFSKQDENVFFVTKAV